MKCPECGGTKFFSDVEARVFYTTESASDLEVIEDIVLRCATDLQLLVCNSDNECDWIGAVPNLI